MNYNRLTVIDSTGVIAGIKRNIGDYATDREIKERLYKLENMIESGELVKPVRYVRSVVKPENIEYPELSMWRLDSYF